MSDVFWTLPEPEGTATLIGCRCRACGRVSFPPRRVCVACGRDDVQQLAVGRRGSIQASAVVHQAPTGFITPYLVALVELAEGPIVFAPITGCPAEEHAVPPGTPVELVIGPARPGGPPVYQFRPVAGDRDVSA